MFPNNAEFSGVLGVCPVSEPGITLTEPRDGDTTLLERTLGEGERAEPFGLSSGGGNGVSDSDPDS